MHSTSDVILRTKSLEDAKAFYHGILGFALAADSDRLVGFETGGFTLYFELGETNGAVFEFEVDDVNEAKRRLLTQECVIVEEDPALPRCYLRDRFGLTFNLTQSYH
jgi:catechol 2,3-dioxygenase-like lactoylglutathione lyase family enzyme